MSREEREEIESDREEREEIESDRERDICGRGERKTQKIIISHFAIVVHIVS